MLPTTIKSYGVRTTQPGHRSLHAEMNTVNVIPPERSPHEAQKCSSRLRAIVAEGNHAEEEAYTSAVVRSTMHG